MHISFDLDGLLIPHANEFETETRSRLAKFFGIEPIRKGSPALIDHLQNQGHTIHIYTTSFRSKTKIRRTLKYYGIRVNRIITQTENQKELSALKKSVSKYPTAFKFDLHIDDSEGVRIEGDRNQFNVVHILPTDTNWVEIVQREVNFKQEAFKGL